MFQLASRYLSVDKEAVHWLAFRFHGDAKLQKTQRNKTNSSLSWAGTIIAYCCFYFLMKVPFIPRPGEGGRVWQGGDAGLAAFEIIHWIQELWSSFSFQSFDWCSGEAARFQDEGAGRASKCKTVKSSEWKCMDVLLLAHFCCCAWMCAFQCCVTLERTHFISSLLLSLSYCTRKWPCVFSSQRKCLSWAAGSRGIQNQPRFRRPLNRLWRCSTHDPRASVCSSWSPSLLLRLRLDPQNQRNSRPLNPLVPRHRVTALSSCRVLRWPTWSTSGSTPSWEKPSVSSPKIPTWRIAVSIKRYFSSVDIILNQNERL